MNFQRVNSPAWVFYLDADRESELANNCGKWMYFFDSSRESASFVERICEQIVKDGVAIEAKHSSRDAVQIQGSGVCCFYCDGSNIEAHKKIIKFLLENNMIKRTKSGKLTNISFKYDEQTRNKQYGDEFKSKIQLSNFVNLTTGEWLDNITLTT
ncbi:MAG: hypothetical protein IJ419_08160 [Agathobacter sp.]|nr:hypothetical protein [Agathobacter sp.]